MKILEILKNVDLVIADIEVNLGKEKHKNGIEVEELSNFHSQCIDIDLNIIGTMCLPPDDGKSELYFSEMKKLNDNLNLKEISMGMSADYLNAIKHGSTFIRIGSKIFGPRS